MAVGPPGVRNNQTAAAGLRAGPDHRFDAPPRAERRRTDKEAFIIKRRFRPIRRARKQNVNEFIRAREVRVVFPDGVTEVLPTSVGVRKAKELGLDLVLVSPSAIPPVCKVIDYGEYTYQEKKKKNEAKKKQHRIEVKEVKFRPNTDDHDYNFKKNHALRFLEEGNKVKATVFFRGREITHSDLGYKLLKNLIGDIAELGEPEGAPRMEGRSMHVIIGPKKKQAPAPAPRPARDGE